MSRTARSTPPVFPSLAEFKRGWVGADALVGLMVLAVLIPEALAYATIAGVTPVVGLYAAVPALVLYAAFGSSRHLVVLVTSGRLCDHHQTSGIFDGGQ